MILWVKRRHKVFHYKGVISVFKYHLILSDLCVALKHLSLPKLKITLDVKWIPLLVSNFIFTYKKSQCFFVPLVKNVIWFFFWQAERHTQSIGTESLITWCLIILTFIFYPYILTALKHQAPNFLTTESKIKLNKKI